MAVILCSTLIGGHLFLSTSVEFEASDVTMNVINGVVIVLAIVAELATMSYQRIELEKDWFVVLTRGNEARLASMYVYLCHSCFNAVAMP